MDTYPCVAQLLPGNGVYQVLDTQYLIPVQQQQPQQHQQLQNRNNSTLQVFQNQNVPILNASATVANMVDVVAVADVSSGRNPPARKGVFVLDNNCYVQQPAANVNGDLCGNARLMTNNYTGQIHVVPTVVQKNQGPQLNANVDGMNENRNNVQPDYRKSNPPEHHMRMMKIPEPTQVEINTEFRERIAALKIHVSESFLSWNAAERTIIDLNFMRELIYIKNVDVLFQCNIPYERGVCDGLNKLIRYKLLSDWLVLKCEEKQIPFFEVNDQIEVYSANNFTTLLTIIAKESCLPLPFITGDGKSAKYFYINFPKSVNNRVKKLKVAIFHDADNGKKKIPCKHPGVRLDCSFESAIQRFDFHVHNSAMQAFARYDSIIRQVIIYNHIVWGFLQAWTRKVGAHHSGCFKVQDIAQNLSLCRGDQTGNPLTDEQELVYYIDYSNFYIKFDPVGVKDRAATFTIQNFETNYVCDVSLVQYYRQFFLINDMHYSDALKNIVLFSQENGARNVTDFVYMTQKDDNVDRSNWYYPPGGISRPSIQQQPPQARDKPARPNITAGLDVHGAKPTAQCGNPQTDPSWFGSGAKVSSNRALHNNQMTNEQVSQGGNIPPPTNAPPSKPLIKTRTVEEINSCVDLKKSAVQADQSGVSFNSILSDKRQDNVLRQANPSLPACIREALNHCFVRNISEITSRDVITDPSVMQQVFNSALAQAKEMTTVEGFIEKLYVTLQKSFTNGTCQEIMNRTICRALQIRFPNLKARLSGQNGKGAENAKGKTETASETIQKTKKPNGSRTCENVKAPNRTGKVSSVKGNEKVSATPKVVTSPQKKPPATPPKPKPQRSPKSNEASMESNRQKQNSPKVMPSKQLVESETMNDLTPLLPSNLKLPKLDLDCDSPPKVKRTDKSEGSSCNVNINVKLNGKKNSECGKSGEKVASPQKGKKAVAKYCENVAEANATFLETGNRISINLTLPLTKGSGNSPTTPTKSSLVRIIDETDSGTPIKGGASSQRRRSSDDETRDKREQSMQTDESRFDEAEMESDSPESRTTLEDLFRRYKIKPCSVVLNANEVANYQRKRERLRKRLRDVVYSTSDAFSDDSNYESDDDSNDNDFVVPEPRSRKRLKRISELQYMEARTRVLQRLRKRNQMYVLSNNGQTVYTSDELDEFFIRNRRNSLTSRSPRSEDSDDKESRVAEENEEDKKYRAMREECLTREARVVLVKLEDTAEYRKRRDKWRVQTKADGRLTLARDYSAEYEKVPKNKRRYFELKDGTLYLKKQYQVKNGRIVSVHGETGQNRVSLKMEPCSPQYESNLPSQCIKDERSLE